MQLKLDEAIRWSQGAPQRHGATRAAGRGAVCAHWGLRETAAMIRRNETKVRLPSPNNARKPGPTQLTPSPGESARARKNYRELRETLRGCLERFIHPPEARTTFLPRHQGDLGRHVVRPICRWRPRRAAFRSTRRRSRLDLTGDIGSKRPTAAAQIFRAKSRQTCAAVRPDQLDELQSPARRRRKNYGTQSQRQWWNRSAERRHHEEPLRAEGRIEAARCQRQQRSRRAGTERIERLRRRR